MEDDQQFCLRWNNHQSTLISVFDSLLENETLVDCTLAAEGKILKAHKVVLSACSPYFATLLQEQYDKHPIFILKDVKYQELRAMMDYMYRGEVNISQDQLAALLKAAESLQIKGLSDNRSGSAPKPDHHRGLNMPGVSGVGSKLSGYTLEHAKRARIGPSSMDSQDMIGSREGSSSPSRRRRKVRRRSIENTSHDAHDNSNSPQIQSNQSSVHQQQSNACLAGVGAITAAASALASQLPVSASTISTGATAAAVGAAAIATSQATTQQLITNVTKKTESVKGTSDAMNTENVQTGSNISADDQDMEHVKGEKQNHKQKNVGKEATELVIEPKSEYDEEGNDETVEDLTLDDEDMGMDDLDHNAGTSQGGEGSSQGYAWQHDRSQEELLLATQDAQQRDPQDLSKRLLPICKENKVLYRRHTHRSNQRTILNNGNILSQARFSTNTDESKAQSSQKEMSIHKRMSMSDVSDMLFKFYNANNAKAPKNDQEQQSLLLNKLSQPSPTSAETFEPSSIAAIATNSAAAGIITSDPFPKNLNDDEMVSTLDSFSNNEEQTASSNISFHSRIKYTTASKPVSIKIIESTNKQNEEVMTSIRTSVVVPNAPQNDIKPNIHPTTGLVISPDVATSVSVIKPVSTNNGGAVNPQAAVIAAALLRDGYHNFQQQLRAQEILNQQSNDGGDNNAPTKLLENFLRQHRDQRNSECDDERYASTASETNDGDDEDDSRLNGFEDIHLTSTSNTSTRTDDPKFMFASQIQAQAFRNFEYSLSDYSSNLSAAGGNTGGDRNSPNDSTADGEAVYECRHCGKKYRWKSTLRRHENVECGGKEPSHQCPYCPYKSKQRGNLGVHVRKHHSNLPQLASKRRSKYSSKLENNMNSAMISDDSSSGKLVIDCQK